MTQGSKASPDAKSDANSDPGGKVAILVLGMHRSGTSMVAGVLERLGCQGPRTPIEPNARNPKGYFESEPLFRLNDRILEALGSRWDDWRPVDGARLASPRFNAFRTEARDIVTAEYGNASLIQIKDPRLCRLLPFWRDVLEGMSFRPHVVHTHRNPLDVAASLERRPGIEVDRDIGLLVWLRHVLDAEAHSRDLPRVFTTYSDVLGDWQGFAEKAETAFGFPWPRLSQTTVQEMRGLLDPALRHHDTASRAVLDDALASELLREALGVLDGWAAKGEDTAQHAVLDRLRDRFDLAAPLFSGPLLRIGQAARQAGRLETAQQALEAAKDELAKSRAAVAAGQADLDAARAATRAATGQVVEQARIMTALRRETQARIDAAEAEADTLTDRIIERDRTIAGLRGTARQADMARDAAETQGAQQRAAHAAEIEQLHQLYRSSTSWRISGPVRGISAVLRRLKTRS